MGGTMSTYIDSDMNPIGKFLGNVTALKVPPFQRNYAWTDEEVKQLWVDITEALDMEQTEYFLGPMVLKKGEDKLEVIDGQQRIATIYIILSVIRRTFRQNGDNERADWFNNEYFGKQDIVTLERKPKFHLNEENDPIFQRFVGADTSEEQIRAEMKGRLKKDPNYLLLQAIITIWDLIEERQKTVSGQEFSLDTLLSIEEFLREHIHVLILTITDEADAYVIFETLNDRGRGLTTMDLLKNHVFGKAGDSLDQVKVLWGNIKDNLADVDPRERFLHHYWTSRFGRTSKSKLFRSMREHVKNAKTAVDFANDISESSKLYAALSIPGHPFWNEYSQKTRDNLETLLLLDAQQALPMLMAAEQMFNEEEFRKLTDVLVVMAVRYNLIGELRTGVLANYYVEIPPRIRSGELKKSAKVFRVFKSIYPSDNDFEEAFAKKVLKDSQKAKYILSEIELGGKDASITYDPKKVNLEHVLPKNPSQDWKDTIASIGKDDLDEYTYRIGNLALVNAATNKIAGAKSFDEKKKLLFGKEEKIWFTKLITDYNIWDKKSIEDRQRKLAKQAVKVWQVPIE